MKTVTLTEAQAIAVLQCLDLSVRAGGLDTAAIALPLAQEIKEQLTAPEQKEGENQ